VRTPSSARPFIVNRHLAVTGSRRDRMLTPVDHFRHHPPHPLAARRAQTVRRTSNHLIPQAIFASAPSGLPVGTRLALPSYQRGSRSLMNISWTITTGGQAWAQVQGSSRYRVTRNVAPMDNAAAALQRSPMGHDPRH
jgi:hypothetical protein